MNFRTVCCIGVLGVHAAGAASAQSSVTIYGIADACVARADLGGSTSQRLASGCQSGSRLGFRGQEDLGGGLRAYFTLEQGINLDEGAIGQGGRGFGRKALVGLTRPGLGSLELGRDYAPAFYLLVSIDPLGLGFGTLSSTMSTGSNPTTVGRNDNAVNYISPSWGPVSLRLQYALGEQASPQPSRGRDTAGANLVLRQGAWLAGVAYASHRNAADNARDTASTVAVSYDFGRVRFAAAFQAGRWEGSRTAAAPSSPTSIFSRDYRSVMLGGTASMGSAGRIAFSWKRYDDRTAPNLDATQWTVLAAYVLSKRTDVYAGFSLLRNSRTGAYGIADATTTYAGVAPGSDPTLAAIGIRHLF